MSKGLEALKNIEKEIQDYEGFDENTYHQMDRTRFIVIETELNEKINIENRLDYIFSKHHIRSFTELEERLGDCKIASQDDIKLKALEIIRKKGVNLFKLKMCDSVEEYNKLCNSASPLTQEEYDLLKEVLL